MRTIISCVSLAGVLSVLAFLYRWFLLKTDVVIGYNWSWQGKNFFPNFDLRNRSGSKTYVVANIAYTRDHGKQIVTFDNTSLWGRELKPGTIVPVSAAPVRGLASMADCLKTEVTVRFQNGRSFRGQGPGQLFTGFHKYARVLRDRIERSSLPLPR
jgi:hypothetical protein